MQPVRKQTIPFQFRYPLKHKLVRDLKIVTEHVGDLVVEATGYFNAAASPIDVFDRYAVDLELVQWNGTDIKPVLEVMGNLEDIEEAAIRHFAGMLEGRSDLRAAA
jgi:hypothetical protein